MKKIAAALALVTLAGTAQANGADIVAGVILGAVITQPRYAPVPPVYMPPNQVIVVPQPLPYVPNPNYQQNYPYPRVITSSEPCQWYGQMVMTFDQYGRPIGYRNCM